MRIFTFPAGGIRVFVTVAPLLASLLASSQALSQESWTPGHPSIGNPGVQETMGHIMARDQAAVIRDALAVSKTPLATPAAGPVPAVDLDTAQLDQIIGVKGQVNGGVYQFAVPRRDPVVEIGMQISPVGPMGVANAIGFQPTGGGKAAITGDFVLTGDEVNPVIKALRANGIDVTAVHSHMLDEQPRLFFLHFWANDDALTLAKGLRAALDKTASTKS